MTTTRDEIRTRTAWACALATTIVAGYALPFVLFVWFLVFIALVAAAAYAVTWQERAMRAQGDYFEAFAANEKSTADNVELAYELDQATFRMNELAAENQRLRDLQSLDRLGISDTQFESVRALFTDPPNDVVPIRTGGHR